MVLHGVLLQPLQNVSKPLMRDAATRFGGCGVKPLLELKSPRTDAKVLGLNSKQVH